MQPTTVNYRHLKEAASCGVFCAMVYPRDDSQYLKDPGRAGEIDAANTMTSIPVEKQDLAHIWPGRQPSRWYLCDLPIPIMNALDPSTCRPNNYYQTEQAQRCQVCGERYEALANLTQEYVTRGYESCYSRGGYLPYSWFGTYWWVSSGVRSLNASLCAMSGIVRSFRRTYGRSRQRGPKGNNPGALVLDGEPVQLYRLGLVTCITLAGEDLCEMCAEWRVGCCRCPGLCWCCGRRAFERHDITCELRWLKGQDPDSEYSLPLDKYRSVRLTRVRMGQGPQDRYDLKAMIAFGVNEEDLVSFAKRTSLSDRSLGEEGLAARLRGAVAAWRENAVDSRGMPGALGINRAAFNVLSRRDLLPPSFLLERYRKGVGLTLEPKWAQEDLAHIKLDKHLAQAIADLPFPTAQDAKVPARFTMAGLRKRGWTEGMVKTLLGDPDQSADNSQFRRGAPMGFYYVDRVIDAEDSEIFARHNQRHGRAAGGSKEELHAK